ncbi:unnamed protein product, partial [Cyprideis torosa]
MVSPSFSKANITITPIPTPAVTASSVSSAPSLPPPAAHSGSSPAMSAAVSSLLPTFDGKDSKVHRWLAEHLQAPTSTSLPSVRTPSPVSSSRSSRGGASSGASAAAAQAQAAASFAAQMASNPLLGLSSMGSLSSLAALSGMTGSAAGSWPTVSS